MGYTPGTSLLHPLYTPSTPGCTTPGRGCHMPGYVFYALRVSFTHGVRYMGPPRCLFPFGCGCGGGVPTLEEGLTGVGGAVVGGPSLGEQERPGGGSSRRHDG
eukprot:8456450-Pyramimonas_sp.AAC.1